MANLWHIVENAGDVPSPALLVYPERIRENIRRMVFIAGAPERLRPHVKTHKMAAVARLQLDAGIRKFKCATIAEAEMLANTDAPDVLLGYQPVGPNIKRLRELVNQFPKTQFSAVADDPQVVGELGAAFENGPPLRVWLDIDCGMCRTGIVPGQAALKVYRLVHQLPGLAAAGLHVYDGHLHDPSPKERRKQWERTMEEVRTFQNELVKDGLPVPGLVAGGTPTFPFHAGMDGTECSPGTTLLWDAGYGSKFPDLEFQLAALVLTRVISKPGANHVTLDLGHKAIASENPHPRVRFIGLENCEATVHSEEHLTLKGKRTASLKVGDCLYGIPMHICPTVALYNEARVVDSGNAIGSWPVTARNRKITL